MCHVKIIAWELLLHEYIKGTVRKMKKRIILPILTLAIIIITCFSFVSTTNAATTQVKVKLGNSEIMSGRSLLVDSITYVPIRDFANAMGGTVVGWNGSTNTATISADGLNLSAGVGKIYINANDRYLYTIGQIININGSVYVPIRPLARAFGLDVSWDGNTYTVTLTKNGSGYIKNGSSFYISDEVYWLSRIINAESAGEPMLGKIAVGNVILNRVADSRYPNTIYNVIFDMKNGVQFTPAATGTVYKAPTADSVIAAKIILEGYRIDNELLFFINPTIAKNTWVSKNRPYVMTIGNHAFYK